MTRSPKPKLQVTKTMSPDQPGAVRLAEKYGPALLVVRYRQDAARLTRYTTVELVVDEVSIAARSHREVGVRIGYFEDELQGRARQAGAKWDKMHGLWRMPLSVAHALGLLDRVARSRKKR